MGPFWKVFIPFIGSKMGPPARQPTMQFVCDHFRFFWDSLLEYCGLDENDVPAPFWATPYNYRGVVAAAAAAGAAAPAAAGAAAP